MDHLGMAMEIKEQTEKDYKALHQMAEVGFELHKTLDYVKNRLNTLGIENEKCGRGGIVGYIGTRSANKCVMLRADMDALPIKEKSGVPFASQTGAMHACGHDAHTAMLLSAAQILKKHESSVAGCVKLVFQGAEEQLSGAKDMIENGVLEDPRVSKAVMLHLLTGTELKSGSVIVSSEGVSAPAVAYFRITVNGKGCHGSTPENGKDPLLALCRTVAALDEIKSREIGMSDLAALTVGMIRSGEAPNAIPSLATADGSMRAFSKETFEYMKNRIKNIVSGITGAFETEGRVEFFSEAPTLINDGEMSAVASAELKKVLSDVTVTTSNEYKRTVGGKGGSGSEDFAFFSIKVPSLMIGLCAGRKSEGYIYPLHHPSVRFDTAAFPYGVATLTALAIKWQNDQK